MQAMTSRWDRTGIILSTICIIHCLFMPFLSAYLLVLGLGIGAEDLTHRIILLLLAGTGLLAFIPGMKKHRDKRVLALASIGFSVITFIAVAGHDILPGIWGSFVNVIGSLFLIGAHLWNHTLSKKSHCCNHAE